MARKENVILCQLEIELYLFSWRKPRYNDHSQQKGGKVRNAPGSRLMGCNATINICLLNLHDNEVLQVMLPLLLAHTNHSHKSLADLHSHKPLPEVILICHSHLSQISLMLTLKNWVNHDLIPHQLQQGILTSRPAEYDRRYYPTVEDVRNMSRSIIHKIRKNLFDQDASETFLL